MHRGPLACTSPSPTTFPHKILKETTNQPEIEHSCRNSRRITPRLRCRPRRRPPLLLLGFQSRRRPTAQRCNRRLGCRLDNHLHTAPFKRRIHIARFRSRCPQRRSLRPHLPRTFIPDAQPVSQTCVEPGPME